MATVLITYDLASPGQKYADLHEAIQAAANWWHCVESTWIIKSDLSLEVIRDRLLASLDSNDKLLVVQLTGAAAWAGFDQDCSSWLTNNL